MARSTDVARRDEERLETSRECPAASLDTSRVLDQCAAFCQDLLAGLTVPPPWIGGRARPLPATATVFARGNLLPSSGFPVIPLREVLFSVRCDLRTRWTCGRHWKKGIPLDRSSFVFELDNYGNILMFPEGNGHPVYVVRSLVAYNPFLVEVARAASPTFGLASAWMQCGPNIGFVPCDLCRGMCNGGNAAFSGYTADCLPHTASLVSLPAASRFALALARHTDLVLAPLESAIRRSMSSPCTSV